ncbi:MAG: HDOD domain-containing protein [Planctomycetes bacterium]|nr:HDOD domain-containing protein [Planctomycetota bacterium]
MNPHTLESAPPSRETELRRQLVQRIAERRLDLPMLPQTAADVMTVCNDTSCDAARLAGLIQRDQALAAHTLHVANSAVYAPREPIVSLQQAVSRLGFKTMCDIAVAVTMRSKIFVLKGQEERLRAMWEHSAMSGAWAKEIARVRRRNVEGAFLSGLLHDIGKPVVLQVVLELGRGSGVRPDGALLDALLQEFHAEVGGIVLASWKLPDWMCAAVRCHHDPELAGEHVEYSRTAMLADLLAHSSAHPDPEADQVLRTHPVLDDLGLYDEETEALFERREAVQQTAEAFR